MFHENLEERRDQVQACNHVKEPQVDIGLALEQQIQAS